jgi:hypothetical protein
MAAPSLSSSAPSRSDPEVIGPSLAPNTVQEGSKRSMDTYERCSRLSLSLLTQSPREEERDRMKKAQKYEKHQERSAFSSPFTPSSSFQLQESN